LNNNSLCVNVDWENEKTYDNNLFNLQHFTFCQERKEFLLAILDLSFLELCWQLSCPCNYVLNQFKLTLLNISKRSPEESLILKLIVLYLSITWELWNKTLLTIIAFLASVSRNYDINQWTWKKEVRQKRSKSTNHKTHAPLWTSWTSQFLERDAKMTESSKTQNCWLSRVHVIERKNKIKEDL